MYIAQRICRKDMKFSFCIYNADQKLISEVSRFICESYELILEGVAYISRKIFFPYKNEPNGLSHYIAYPISNAETFFFLDYLTLKRL